MPISEIEIKKQCCPRLLLEELMDKSVDIIKALRLDMVLVSYSVIAAVVRGLVMSHDRIILEVNGGHLKFSNDWARRILYRITKDEKDGRSYCQYCIDAS